MELKGFRAITVVGVLLMLIPASAQASVILQDTFALTDTRTAGSILSLKPVETSTVGAVTWNNSGSGWKFAAGGFVQNASGAQLAAVSLGSAVPLTNPITVSTDLNFNGAASGNAIVALSTSSGGYPYNLPLYLQVNVTGAWNLYQYQGTTRTALATGTGLSTATGFHALQVEYTPSTTSASAWYDGVALATDKTLQGGFNPSITYACFGDNLVANLQADNFVVDVTPEPTTLALMVSSAGLVVLRRRR
jgi:hypothetical protein